MSYKILLFFIVSTNLFLYAVGPDILTEKKILLKKASNEIIVDGLIDAAWNLADSVHDFTQYNPFYGGKPTQRTTAKILTTDDALYCLMILYDNTGKIEANKGTHDNMTGDGSTLIIDTYNDKRTAYEFDVCATGVKADARMLDDGRNRDWSWDGVWFAEAKIYDWGYVTEVKIPYKSISYDKSLNEWGVDFGRWIPNNNEDISWSNYEENEGIRVSKMGKLMFDNVQPKSEGMNLEIYPVGLTNVSLQEDGKYKVSPDAGLDVFYNPSPSLTYQLTVNPDFAQIEADPYSFNISRYESYFSERRPFFTQGSEIFMPSGKDRNSGFYSPMELFYSRRIGKKLPNGEEVRLLGGTKAFGRIDDWEYGGFLAMTGEEKYNDGDELKTEDRAVFGVARLKKQIFDNSTIGAMFVGKKTKDHIDGVIDIDGALRQTDWQLAYQFARSIKDKEGDFASALGFMMFDKNKIILSRLKYVGEKFDISQVGFVPWKGTAEWTAIGGPRWYYEEGYIRQILIYAGFSLYDEKADLYTDHSAILGFNMQFRDNWGYEINVSAGKSRDADQKYDSYEVSLSSWYNITPRWSGNLWGGYSKTYNFSRDYLASYMWMGNSITWYATKNLSVGADNNLYMERKPDGSLEDVTFNTRPNITFIPINYLTTRLYVDNVYVKSTQHLENLIVGFLFSYNFLPKSWIYLAYNEFQERQTKYDEFGNNIGRHMKVTDRASVFKIKYLYYF
jgi:hypothetical protein